MAVPALHRSDTPLGRLGPWEPAQRHWRGNAPDLDVVARSVDGRRLLVGEAKWSSRSGPVSRAGPLPGDRRPARHGGPGDRRRPVRTRGVGHVRCLDRRALGGCTRRDGRPAPTGPVIDPGLVEETPVGRPGWPAITRANGNPLRDRSRGGYARDNEALPRIPRRTTRLSRSGFACRAARRRVTRAARMVRDGRRRGRWCPEPRPEHHSRPASPVRVRRASLISCSMSVLVNPSVPAARACARISRTALRARANTNSCMSPNGVASLAGIMMLARPAVAASRPRTRRRRR